MALLMQTPLTSEHRCQDSVFDGSFSSTMLLCLDLWLVVVGVDTSIMAVVTTAEVCCIMIFVEGSVTLTTSLSLTSAHQHKWLDPQSQVKVLLSVFRYFRSYTPWQQKITPIHHNLELILIVVTLWGYHCMLMLPYCPLCSLNGRTKTRCGGFTLNFFSSVVTLWLR